MEELKRRKRSVEERLEERRQLEIEKIKVIVEKKLKK